MIQRRPFSEALVLGAILLVAVAIRLPFVIEPPAGGLMNVDELELALSGVDRWAGLPTTSLAWPGATQHLIVGLYTIFATLTAWLQVGGDPLLHLANAVAHQYVYPQDTITVIRAFSIAVTVTAPVLATIWARHAGCHWPAALFAATPFLFAQPFVIQSVQATGDAAAVTLALAAVVLLTLYPRAALASGILIGVAAATKTTSATVGILPLLTILVQPDASLRRRFWRAGVYLSGIALGLLFLVPEIWQEPLRLGKAIFGNALIQREGADPPASPWILAALAVGLIGGGGMALRTSGARRRQAVVALLGGAIMLLPLISGSFKFVRYALPMLVPFAILLPLALENLRSWRWQAGVITAAVAVMLAFTALDFVHEREGQGQQALFALLDKACLEGATDIYLPMSLYFERYFDLPYSQAFYAAAFRRTSERALAMKVKGAAGQSWKTSLLPETFERVFSAALGEDAIAQSGRLGVAAEVAPERPCTYHAFAGRSTSGAPFAPGLTGMMSALFTDEARQAFRASRRTSVLVTWPAPDVEERRVFRSAKKEWMVLTGVRGVLPPKAN